MAVDPVISRWRPTWFNFNPNTDKNFTHYKKWNETTYLLPNFNGAAVEFWQWMNNFIQQFAGMCDYLQVTYEI